MEIIGWACRLSLLDFLSFWVDLYSTLKNNRFWKVGSLQIVFFVILSVSLSPPAIKNYLGCKHVLFTPITSSSCLMKIPKGKLRLQQHSKVFVFYKPPHTKNICWLKRYCQGNLGMFP